MSSPEAKKYISCIHYIQIPLSKNILFMFPNPPSEEKVSQLSSVLPAQLHLVFFTGSVVSPTVSNEVHHPLGLPLGFSSSFAHNSCLPLKKSFSALLSIETRFIFLLWNGSDCMLVDASHQISVSHHFRNQKLNELTWQSFNASGCVLYSITKT